MPFVVEPVEGVQNMRATIFNGIRFHFFSSVHIHFAIVVWYSIKYLL